MKSYGSIYNSDQQEESQEFIETSKFKRVAAQCCGVLASDCLRFTMSTFAGFQIILIAELHKESSEIAITFDQLTWIPSLNFLIPVGTIINGFITQRVGNRFVMMMASVFNVIVWVSYYYATDSTTIIATRIMYALTGGALKAPASIYITEISQPHLRGSFLASNHLAATFGMFFSLLMGSMFYWRTIALINIIFPIITFVLVLYIPESPFWLASKGRFADAEASLSWLRGWVDPIYVKSEYRSLIDRSFADHRSASHSTNESINIIGRREKLRALFKPYLHRSFYLPLASMTLIYFIHFFSGISAIETYAMVVFQQMNSPIDESVATAIMGAVRVVGAFVILFSIRLTGKRKLMFLSLIGAGCCYLAASTAGFLIQQEQVNSNVYLWIPPIAMLLAILSNASGAETIVHMLNSEIFPVSIRNIGASMGGSISSIMQATMNKAFLYIVDGITLPGLFLYFTVMHIIAIGTYYFIFPETEGRSLREIEDHFKGIKNLKDRSKKQYRKKGASEDDQEEDLKLLLQ